MRKILWAITLYMICIGCLYSQTMFNKIIGLNRDYAHVFLSLTPLDDKYVMVCGTGNHDMFGNMRCALVTHLDNQGNSLYNAFVGDTATYTWESYFGQEIIRTGSASFKYVFNKENLGAYICEFNDTLGIKKTSMLYYAQDSSFTDENFVRFSYIDGYIYIYGEKRGDTINNDFFHGTLWKIDSLNNLVWKRNLFNGVNKLNCGQVQKSYDGNLILIGRTLSNTGKYWHICKVDTSGNTLWCRDYGRQGWNNGIDIFIVPSPDSCYVINSVYPVCYIDNYMEEASYAGCLRKIDDNGNLVWEKVVGTYYKTSYLAMSYSCGYYDLHIDEDGYIYVVSTDVGIKNNYDRGSLTKYSQDGEIMFRRYYYPLADNMEGDVTLGSISPTTDGGFVMGGYTGYSPEIDEMFNGYYQQPWIVKTDHEGLDGHCYTELPELEFDIFIPDTVCNLDTLDCVVNISGPSAPYTLGFSTGQVIDSIYYPNVFMPASMGIDFTTSSPWLYEYNVYIHEATLKDTIRENIIAKHYNIATPTYPGEQQLAITLTDFYGNTKTIYKDLYVNPCHEVEVDENENVVLSVYPNPARENIVVEGENIAGIEICNLLGGVVYETQQCNGNNIISTENMPAGSYFVRVRMEDGKVVTKKIVVVE